MERGQDKATLERNTMREVILERLNWYITLMDTTTISGRKKKGKQKD